MSDRRHSAIMFTDIVGYTALMGADEDKAFEILEKNTEIHNKLIAEHNGALIKAMGDGMLISFNLASDAVRCAIEIQKSCKEQDIPLKIGIHEGEMVFAGSDVLGDSVNIASRLQEDAEKGCIHISSSVYKNVRNKADINTRFVEERTFKNVAEPVKVYQVLGDGEEQIPVANNQKSNSRKYLYYIIAGFVIVIVSLLIWNYYPKQPSVILDKSIAVLPLDYLSEDQNKQYLADGVMDAITGHLSKIEGLRVTPKTSVEQYRETTKSASVIGAELNVSYLIEGSFLMQGGQVRLTIQLITAEDEDHVWFEEYDRNWEDIFLVQSEVAKAIAEEVEIAIAPDVIERIESIPTENLEAYDLYLKGNSLPFSNEGVYEAMEYYNQAIELSPKFSLAYTRLGYCYWYLAHFSGTQPAPFWTESLKALEKAIELDSLNGEAYAELGVVKHNWEWDINGARQAFKQALRLSPNNNVAHNHYAWFLSLIGDYIAAKKQYQIIEELDLQVRFNSLIILLGEGKYAQATEEHLESDPDSTGWVYNWYGGQAFLASGQLEKGIASLEQSVSVSGTTIDPLALLGYAYAVTGDFNRADSIQQQLTDASKVRHIPSIYFAWISMGFEEYELAFEYLNMSFDEHDFRLHWMLFMPLFDPIRSDPRFADILNRSWNGQLNYKPEPRHDDSRDQ